MGRKPCCDKEGLNRGAWSAWEDKILTSYIEPNGEGKWRDLPQRAGLNRCGKSYKLRWFNYLRPDIKRGNISSEEEELIIRLHKLLGNRSWWVSSDGLVLQRALSFLESKFPSSFIVGMIMSTKQYIDAIGV